MLQRLNWSRGSEVVGDPCGIRIWPSLYAAGVEHAEKFVSLLSDDPQGVSGIHVDIMDGVAVPLHSWSINDLRLILDGCPLPLEVHLMVDDIEAAVSSLMDFNISRLFLHLDDDGVSPDLLTYVRHHEIEAGVAMPIDLEVSRHRDLLRHSDAILVMTSAAGTPNAAAIGDPFARVREVIREVDEVGIKPRIEVDGGVTFAHLPVYAELQVADAVIGRDFIRNLIQTGRW